jgi:hypothetical protein
VFADSILAAEQLHLVILFAWAATSVLAGTAVLAAVHWRFRTSAFLHRFGLVMLLWGGGLFLVAMAGWHGLALRDFGSAAQLRATVRVSLGVDVVAMLLGAGLAAGSWVRARRLGPVGAGTAMMLQGAVLLVLHLRLLRVLAG